MSNNLAPIVLFVYNRLDHTKKTIEALQKNSLANKSELFIYSDGPKNDDIKEKVKEVRKYIKTIKGFKNITIIEREVNFGLAKSIINGVTEIFHSFDKVIVLEDDLITTSDFLEYMNEGLNTFDKREDIFSITGVNYPISYPKEYDKDIFLFYRCASWSWATWKDRWKKVDWEVKDFKEFIKDNPKVRLFNESGEDMSDMLTAQLKGKIDSWAIRWCYAHFKNSAYCVYPKYAKVRNIGFDGSGVHCSPTTTKFDTILSNKKIAFDKDIKINNEIVKEMQKLYRYNLKNRVKKIIKRLIGYYKI